MINAHPTDEEIQDYSNGADARGQVAVHIRSCESCQARVAEYQLLFATLASMPAEGFSFDLEAMLMQQVENRAPAAVPGVAVNSRRSAGGSLWWILLALAGITGPVLLVVRYSSLLGSLISAAGPLVIPLVATAALTFTGFLVADMLRQYRKKLALLENNSFTATS